MFRPYSPVKMSDMEDDFMCDDEEDYDLVSEVIDRVLHASVIHLSLNTVIIRQLG